MPENEERLGRPFWKEPSPTSLVLEPLTTDMVLGKLGFPTYMKLTSFDSTALATVATNFSESTGFTK